MKAPNVIFRKAELFEPKGRVAELFGKLYFALSFEHIKIQLYHHNKDVGYTFLLQNNSFYPVFTRQVDKRIIGPHLRALGVMKLIM